MATGGKDRDTRAARERARLYQARRELHAAGIRRRSRDSIVAAIVGGVIVLGAIGAQALYFSTGPGAPAPVESTPVPTESSSPAATPLPDDSAAPIEQTPAPSVAP